MPIELMIDGSTGVARFTVSGEFTLDDMRAAVDRLAADPDYRPGMAILSDHRAIARPASAEEVAGLVGHVAEHGGIFAGARMAIVTDSAASYGMMRMLSALAEDVPMKIAVFLDAAEAERWLRP
ncbi:MAG: STAS/SEC14 domain-containing protein [Gemmatimonadota bacterium]|nr:STAS/SEC14 domain-containing protein [Gemmatimonadota bacterium]